MPLSGNIVVISIETFHFRIGLGTLLSGARHITDGMLRAAAEWYMLFGNFCSTKSYYTRHQWEFSELFS